MHLLTFTLISRATNRAFSNPNTRGNRGRYQRRAARSRSRLAIRERLRSAAGSEVDKERLRVAIGSAVKVSQEWGGRRGQPGASGGQHPLVAVEYPAGEQPEH